MFPLGIVIVLLTTILVILNILSYYDSSKNRFRSSRLKRSAERILRISLVSVFFVTARFTFIAVRHCN